MGNGLDHFAERQCVAAGYRRWTVVILVSTTEEVVLATASVVCQWQCQYSQRIIARTRLVPCQTSIDGFRSRTRQSLAKVWRLRLPVGFDLTTYYFSVSWFPVDVIYRLAPHLNWFPRPYLHSLPRRPSCYALATTRMDGEADT